MAKNFVQPGDSITFVAAANATSGGLVVIGQMFGVADYSQVTGEQLTITCGGVWDLPKANAASTSMAVGANVYWDATNSVATPTNTFTRVGVCTAAVGNTATVVRVRLNDSF